MTTTFFYFTTHPTTLKFEIWNGANFQPTYSSLPSGQSQLNYPWKGTGPCTHMIYRVRSGYYPDTEGDVAAQKTFIGKTGPLISLGWYHHCQRSNKARRTPSPLHWTYCSNTLQSWSPHSNHNSATSLKTHHPILSNPTPSWSIMQSHKSWPGIYLHNRNSYQVIHVLERIKTYQSSVRKSNSRQFPLHQTFWLG